MEIKTQVVWADLNAGDSSTIDVSDPEWGHLQTRRREVFTDADADTRTVIRYWVDLESAQNWLNHIAATNPISATIVTE